MQFELKLIAEEPCEHHIGWLGAVLFCDEQDVGRDTLDALLHDVLPESRFGHIAINNLIVDIRDSGGVLDYQKLAKSNFEIKVEPEELIRAKEFVNNSNNKIS